LRVARFEDFEWYFSHQSLGLAGCKHGICSVHFNALMSDPDSDARELISAMRTSDKMMHSSQTCCARRMLKTPVDFQSDGSFRSALKFPAQRASAEIS
jgi:hypothetical protein